MASDPNRRQGEILLGQELGQPSNRSKPAKLRGLEIRPQEDGGHASPSPIEPQLAIAAPDTALPNRDESGSIRTAWTSAVRRARRKPSQDETTLALAGGTAKGRMSNHPEPALSGGSGTSGLRKPLDASRAHRTEDRVENDPDRIGLLP